MLRLALCACLVLAATLANAHELENTHLFGFTLGSDVNEVGEIEAESETSGRFGKGVGTYSALSQLYGLKFVPFHNFSIEPVVSVSRFDIWGVPGLDDRRETAFEGAGLEMRYRVMEREKAPFGLTFGFGPGWARVDEMGGEPVNKYGADLLMIVDKELVEGFLFGAVNFVYEFEAAGSRETGEWEHGSELGISGALAFQIRPGVFLGGEARLLRSYDGLGLDRFTGNAVFMGPTFYAKFSEKVWMSAAWSTQVAGRAVDVPGSLDLTNFERHQGILRFGYNF